MDLELLKNIIDGANDTVDIDLCEEAKRWVDRMVADNAQLNRQVTDVQRRCTELLLENRELRKGRSSFSASRTFKYGETVSPEDLYREETERRLMLFKDAAHGLRKLAAKYPEPPAEDECGEQSRVYYELLANELEKLTKETP